MIRESFPVGCYTVEECFITNGLLVDLGKFISGSNPEYLSRGFLFEDSDYDCEFIC